MIPIKRNSRLNAPEWEEISPTPSTETFRERSERARNLARRGESR